jgi:hypothetical protein
MNRHCECCDCEECKESARRLAEMNDKFLKSGGPERLRRMFGGTIPEMTTNEYFTELVGEKK